MIGAVKYDIRAYRFARKFIYKSPVMFDINGYPQLASDLYLRYIFAAQTSFKPYLSRKAFYDLYLEIFHREC